MWLLGCGVVVKKIEASEVNNSLAERVGKLLQDSSVPLSEGAENCRKIILSQQDIMVINHLFRIIKFQNFKPPTFVLIISRSLLSQLKVKSRNMWTKCAVNLNLT